MSIENIYKDSSTESVESFLYIPFASLTNVVFFFSSCGTPEKLPISATILSLLLFPTHYYVYIYPIAIQDAGRANEAYWLELGTNT